MFPTAFIPSAGLVCKTKDKGLPTVSTTHFITPKCMITEMPTVNHKTCGID